jgi:hypothetical protein
MQSRNGRRPAARLLFASGGKQSVVTAQPGLITLYPLLHALPAMPA